MSLSHRRTVTEHHGDAHEKRKSGIFFFNNRFKRASVSKSESEGINSHPETPALEPQKDGIFMRRSDSARSIPALATMVTAEAHRPRTARTLSQSVARSPQDSAFVSMESRKLLTSVTQQPETAQPQEPHPAYGTTTAMTSSPKSIRPRTTQSELQPKEPSQENDHVSENESGNAQPVKKQQEMSMAAPATTVPEAPPVSLPQPQANKMVSYHENADLHVRVRDTDNAAIVYSVCADNLASASRVWRRDLQKQPQGANNIDMLSAADTARGLDILFSIAHYKFHELPDRPGVSGLYDLALAADKYEATHLLVPFMKEWIAGLNRHVLVAGAHNDEDKTLVLSWVFGEARWFSRVLSKAAYKARVSPDGRLLDSRGKLWEEQPVPSEILTIIEATRADAIDKIIKAVSAPVHKLLNPQWYPGEEVKYCRAPEGDSAREDCEQLQLGSAIMGLTKAKLWPPPEPSKIKVSAVELAQAYGDVKIRRYQIPGLRFRDQEGVEDLHAQCGFGHREAIDRVLGTQAVLTQSIVEQLRVRAMKSGAFGEELFEDLKDYIGDDATHTGDEDDLQHDPVHYKQVTVKSPIVNHENLNHDTEAKDIPNHAQDAEEESDDGEQAVTFNPRQPEV